MHNNHQHHHHRHNKRTELGVFFREFLRTFHTTGAIAPSGRFLAFALTRFVNQPGPGRKILEVGPGTGSVTRRIIASMGPEDHLDLVELNDRFVQRLQHRFEVDAQFHAVAGRSRILHCPVEDLTATDHYDLIISGLPLNNFAAATVERILGVLMRLSKPGGVLSFFEYIGVRKARALVSGRQQRTRLRGIAAAMHGLTTDREIRRDCVWLNVPPAWVHHVRL
jgi:phosphatidylethanolamine/phosphatidyl-N-methylethanolamine N-methyltransferase